MIRLEGAANFRDLGGYPTAGGSLVRCGMVFRSGHLGALTRADLDALAQLRVAHVFDLRSDQERHEARVEWGGHPVEFHAIPMGNAQMAEGLAAFLKRLVLMDADEAHAMMRSLMEDMVLNEGAQLGQLMASLAAGRTPAIVHCTAGKDRTGLASAILLRLLDVPREAIFEDYLKTNAVSAGNLPMALRFLKKDVIRVLLGVEPGYLEAAFRAMDRRYGSFEGYWREVLGLSADQVEALRAGLVEA
jgi:protein-tyrosine phosphatase